MSKGENVFPILYNMAKGKYIALCEGDDYWTDVFKLQKQVDFLEKNKDYILIGHNAKINKIQKETKITVKNIKTNYTDFTKSDLIIANPFVTGMTMFRNIGFEDLSKILKNFNVGDWPLFTMLAHKGKCRFYSEPVGFYRLHPNSLTIQNRIKYSSFRNEYINRINHAKYWNNINQNEYQLQESFVTRKRSKALVHEALKNLDLRTALHYSKYISIEDLSNSKSKIVVRLLKSLNNIFQ